MGKEGEPGDMPLMPPIHDTGFWYHALIGQITYRLLTDDRFDISISHSIVTTDG